jgi:RNA polymerase sigma-70 factor, ECF subfamily
VKAVELDGFIIAYVRRKVRELEKRRGFSPQERQDLENELLMAVVERLPKLDITKARRMGFIGMIVDRKLISLLRERQAMRRDAGQVTQSLNVPVADSDGTIVELGEMIDPEREQVLAPKMSPASEAQIDLAIDLQQIIDRLPAELRDLAEQLKVASLSSIARATGIPRSTLFDRQREIRRIFSQAGLDCYV